MDDEAIQQLQMMEPILRLTRDGQVTLIRSVGNTEDFIVACLVGQSLAHRTGKASSQGMSVDDLIGAGGLAQRVARQTIYNTTSALAKNKIIRKEGNSYFVDERTVLQFFSAKLPALISRD